MAQTVHLHTPITEEEIRKLQLDDIVYLSGDAYSMLYADHYTLIMELMKESRPIPMNLKDGVIYNTGTIWRRTPEGGYDMRALGATTSSKFNEQTPEFIRKTGIRVIIGKGGMDSKTQDSMKENGCVYLAIVGGCSALYTPAAELTDDYFPEMMPVDNQRLKFSMKEFGPLFVAMDAHGNSLYEQCALNVYNRLDEIYKKIGVR